MYGGINCFCRTNFKIAVSKSIIWSIYIKVSATSIIFIVLEQTISGILQGFGKSYVPAIALGVGVIVKLILNNILIPINPEIFILGGTAGAAVSTTICHLVAFTIDMYVMSKYIKLDLKISSYIVKPIIATIMMAICAIYINKLLLCIISEKLCTILSLLIAAILYVILVFCLKIFSKDNIFMITYGQKIYKMLRIVGIYRD